MRASKFFRSAIQDVTIGRVEDFSPDGLDGWGKGAGFEETIRGIIQEKAGSMDPTKEDLYGLSATASVFVPKEYDHIGDYPLTDLFGPGDYFYNPQGVQYQIISISPVKVGEQGKIIGDFTMVIRGVKK